MKMDPARHLPYFAVLGALSEPGCFLCTLLSGETRRYLQRILDEYVNDTGFRNEWRAARGFCHRHSWMLADAPEALGLAILYLDLVDVFGEDLLARQAGAECPVCASEESHAKTHLKVLAAHWSEAELRDAVVSSEGLCGPHLRMAIKVMRPGEPRDALQRSSIANIAALRSQLSALVDSFDYRNPPPKDDAVRLAWRRAIDKLVGGRDTSGNDT